MDVTKWQQSPIFITVRAIQTGPDVPYKVTLSAILHTVTQDYPVYKVLSEDFVRDYATKMMDDNKVTVMIPTGDYAFLVYPNKDNLELTITKTYIKPIGDTEDDTMPAETVRYKCLFDPRNPSFTTNDIGNYSQQALNTQGFQTINFRLMDRNVEPLRVKQVQGIFRGVMAQDLITGILLGESQQVQVDGQPAVTGLDMVPPDNTQPIGQITISSGRYIREVPTLIQESGLGGIYKYGIGTYYQRYKNNTPTWFVYPLYNFNRFQGGAEQNVAIFYFAPPKFNINIERTYRVNAGLLEAIVTTEKYQINSTDITQLNDGVGYRMADPNAFMKKPVIIDQNGNAIGARGNLNHEVSYLDRGDGLAFVPVNSNLSSNPFHEVSKISARQTTLIKFGWENGDEDLIYPGMPCKCVYMQDDNLCEILGTIQGHHTSRTRQGKGLGDPDRYSTKLLLTVATELNTQLPVYDPTQSFDPAAASATSTS